MSSFGDNIQFNLYKTMLNPDPNRLPVVYEEWEEHARDILDDGPFYYVAGGAGGHKTMRENLQAFDRWQLVSRMLQNVGERDLAIELFGQTYPFPVLHAPIGVQSIIHKKATWVQHGHVRSLVFLSLPAPHLPSQWKKLQKRWRMPRVGFNCIGEVIRMLLLVF